MEDSLNKFLLKLFSIALCGLLFFLNLASPAYALVRHTNGVPDWHQVSFDNMGTVQGSNYGIVDDMSMLQQLGYNPSRAFEAGMPVSATIKVGDLSIFGLDDKSFGSFLGGVDPNKVSLSEFKALNGTSLNDLIKGVPGLGSIPVSAVPLVQSLVSGDRGQIANNTISLMREVSPEVSKYLAANPWAKDLPIEQLLNGDWKDAALQGALKIGLPKLVQAVPALGQVPLGDILSAASASDWRGLASVGAETLIGQFAANNPYLSNLPIGALTNISNFSVGSIPGLARTAITAIPGLKNQLIKNVPGLTNVSLDVLLGLLNTASAKIDHPDAGAQSATRALTGGGYSFQSTPCTTGVCPNFEVNSVKTLVPGLGGQINGAQFVVGSLDSKKGQSVKGGKGILGKMFGGKEPVHIRPWGDAPNVSMAATKVDDNSGNVSFALYLRICANIPFVGTTCSPYSIGPIPFTTIHQDEWVVIQSQGQPPISSPTIDAGSDCGNSSSGGTVPAPSSNPNAPTSQQNLKRYLDRIAWGESSGGVNLGPNALGATGKYQFIPSTRDEILRKYGYDGWNSSQWDNAAIALIKDVGGQSTLNKIAAGDFTSADRSLNQTWTSLPGGAEQSPSWTNQSNLARYGPVNGGAVGGTLLASSGNSTVCGTPIPCENGKTCILLNPNPRGKIPFASGMYGAPRSGRIHAGVDLQSPKGAQNYSRGPGDIIRAAADGKVSESVPVGGRCGGIVAIKHPNPNLETRYVHMVQVFVKRGETVQRGQSIGVEGNETPGVCSRGTHLHYEIYVGSGTTDPTKVQHEPRLPTSPG
jgi:murein DD-endopeptidase MepM/ murein hydrolase activator NlpD